MNKLLQTQVAFRDFYSVFELVLGDIITKHSRLNLGGLTQARVANDCPAFVFISGYRLLIPLRKNIRSYCWVGMLYKTVHSAWLVLVHFIVLYF